jgi:hypothetical protein
MQFFRRTARFVAAPLAAVMVFWSVPMGAARAGMVSTEELLDRGAAGGERTKVLGFLAREDVRAHLRFLGVDPAEAVARAGSLSDREVRDLAGRIDDLPAGQDAFAAVLGAALLIFLILLITDLLGLTHVFPFTKRR